MPTIFRSGPYRFFFYATDRNEPRHVHAEREDKLIKFWLDPVRMQYSIGFSPNEIRRIEKIVQQHRDKFLEAWDAYFSG